MFRLLIIICLTRPYILQAKPLCEILVLPRSTIVPPLEIHGCEIGGNMLVGGPHIMGKFIVDLSKLYSPYPAFDKRMKQDYFDIKLYRYALLDLHPIDIGDKKFKAWFRLNGVAQTIEGHVIDSSSRHLETYFLLDLSNFNFKPAYDWDLIYKWVLLHAKVNLHVAK